MHRTRRPLCPAPQGSAPLGVEEERVAATAGRIAKRDAIAACLRGCAPAEIAVAVAFLSGDIRQGRIGIGDGESA